MALPLPELKPPPRLWVLLWGSPLPLRRPQPLRTPLTRPSPLETVKSTWPLSVSDRSPDHVCWAQQSPAWFCAVHPFVCLSWPAATYTVVQKDRGAVCMGGDAAFLAFHVPTVALDSQPSNKLIPNDVTSSLEKNRWHKIICCFTIE